VFVILELLGAGKRLLACIVLADCLTTMAEKRGLGGELMMAVVTAHGWGVYNGCWLPDEAGMLGRWRLPRAKEAKTMYAQTVHETE
jgi:hypothetical protein